MALIMGAAMFGPVLAWLIWRSPGYKRVLLDRPPGAEWVLTEEAFIDPSSKQVAQVWINPASGERTYVRRPGFIGPPSGYPKCGPIDRQGRRPR